jgi:hypothetical protein
MEIGLFTVDHDERLVRGILVPHDVMSKTSMTKNKPLRFRKGDVRVPRDPSIVTFNVEHDRFNPIGRGAFFEPREQGVYAEFHIANTDDGDAWLADHAETAMLSAELRNIVRGAGDWATAEIVGAAAVREGAFEGAGLFSVDPEPDVTIEITVDDDEETEGDEPEETDPATAEPDEEPDEEPDKHEEEPVADATAPDTMLASRRHKAETPSLTKAGFFAAANMARKTGDHSFIAPYQRDIDDVGLFALSNIKYDGTGGLITDAAMPGAWLGQLWTGKTFQRRIVPLLSGKPLTALSMTGWVWGVKPAMAAWAGNKTAVPSNAPTVVPKSFAASRFAGGHDLAREYYDFGVTDVIDSYAESMIDSYAKLSDAYALTQLAAGATPYTPDPANTVNEGLLDIVDGALAVIAAGGTPSWAIVAPDIYKKILATPHEDALDYLSATIGLESGTVSSGFPIVPDARLAAGSIIVGDKAGATVWELPGVPIRVSALDLVLGGVDNAFFGYIGVGVTTPAVVVKNTGVVDDSSGVLAEGVLESVQLAAEKSRAK